MLDHRFHLALIAASVVALPVASGEVTFTDVTSVCGIQPYTMAFGMGGGAAAADFDDDGDVDIFVPNGIGVPDQLYLNLGNGLFAEVADARGVASLQNNRAALWIDYDGDSDLDLLVVADDHMQTVTFAPSTLTLYEQTSDGKFSDVTVAAGLHGQLYVPGAEPTNHLGGLCAGDVDRNGYLDLLLTFWRGSRHLYLNDGNGGFSDVTAAAGLSVPFETFWQPLMHDFDGDGWLDIFCAVDFNTNDLFINQRDGTFVNVADDLGLGNNEQNDMGAALGDYDDDGDLDLFITNIYSGENRRNHLFRQDAAGPGLFFTDVGTTAGVADGSWGWGTSFADMDRDTHLDLIMTNGWNAWDDPSRFFLHQGDDPPTFVDVASATGFDDTDWGSSLLAFDYDRDGDLDALQACYNGPLRLRDAESKGAAANHGYLVVRPRMNGTNHRAIGAIVRVTSGSKQMTRLITAGTSLMGQEPAEAFFGLGSGVETVSEVRLEWPDGRVTVVEDVPADQVITVTDAVAFPACTGDVDRDGEVGFVDLLALLAAWGPCPACLADVDGDGVVGFPDLLALLAQWGACP